MTHIRLLTAHDGPEYQKLRLEALQTNAQVFLNTFETESSWHESAYAHELEYSYAPPYFGYYGIFEEDNLLGFCQITKSYLDKQRHIAFLYNLYVGANHRQRGLASNLMEHIFDQLSDHEHLESVFLSCIASNKVARKFYEKNGFKRCGIKPKSVKWQDRYDDEIEMVLRLSD
jgi:RimJ/RimL family protein N-acetyltransferase